MDRPHPACYQSDHGVYPRSLEELVPRYLPSVPLAKYALVDHSYHYYCEGGETGTLRWTYMG